MGRSKSYLEKLVGGREGEGGENNLSISIFSREVDYTVQRGLDRKTIMHLSDSSWVTGACSIIVSDPTSVGKSFMAQALGAQVCALGHRTLYFNCSKLFQTLKDRRNDGSFRRFMNRIAKTPLLILDAFGLAALDVHDRLSLLEIVEDRHGRTATIIASQLPVAR
ncbi:MAG: ATP-binding protein [Spirochaetota bacterium]